MHLQKEHLTGDYDWATESAQPAFSGEPTRRLFNRSNGDQVLFIINHYVSDAGGVKPDDSALLEELITKKMPEAVRSEISVLQWLKDIRKPRIE